MSEKYIFTILGGDLRQSVIAKKLLSLGHTVRIYGLNAEINNIPGAEFFNSPDKAILGSNVVLLPLPASRDSKTINLLSTDDNTQLTLSDALHMISKNQNTYVLGGLVPMNMIEDAKKNGINIYDYYDNEMLQLRNALPSAEGAIMVAMENTEKVLDGMNVLISGYGRIGKILAEKLRLLGARVTVAARRDEVLCEISLAGFNSVRINDDDELSSAVKESEVIFNTVPHMVFTERNLSKYENKPLYIEMASSPGGIDVYYARNHGMRMIFAPSLPGRYAPVSAGEYIFETIKDMLAQGGMKL